MPARAQQHIFIDTVLSELNDNRPRDDCNKRKQLAAVDARYFSPFSVCWWLV
jgi:hypothetical protein